MATNENIDLEEKVNLLLALAVDERLWPAGGLSDERKMLETLGIDLGQSDRVRHILTVLSHFNERYFLSRGWVGQKLDEVVHRLHDLEQTLQDLNESAKRNTRALSENAARLDNLDKSVVGIRDDARSSLSQTRDLGEAISKLTAQYSMLQTDSADIKTSLSDLGTQFKETREQLEKINEAILKNPPK